VIIDEDMSERFWVLLIAIATCVAFTGCSRKPQFGPHPYAERKFIVSREHPLDEYVPISLVEVLTNGEVRIKYRDQVFLAPTGGSFALGKADFGLRVNTADFGSQTVTLTASSCARCRSKHAVEPTRAPEGARSSP